MSSKDERWLSFIRIYSVFILVRLGEFPIMTLWRAVRGMLLGVMWHFKAGVACSEILQEPKG